MHSDCTLYLLTEPLGIKCLCLCVCLCVWPKSDSRELRDGDNIYIYTYIIMYSRHILLTFAAKLKREEPLLHQRLLHLRLLHHVNYIYVNYIYVYYIYVYYISVLLHHYIYVTTSASTSWYRNQDHKRIYVCVFLLTIAARTTQGPRKSNLEVITQ